MKRLWLPYMEGTVGGSGAVSGWRRRHRGCLGACMRRVLCRNWCPGKKSSVGYVCFGPNACMHAKHWLWGTGHDNSKSKHRIFVAGVVGNRSCILFTVFESPRSFYVVISKYGNPITLNGVGVILRMGRFGVRGRSAG